MKKLTPFRLEGFGLSVFFVTLWPLFSPTEISVGAIILKNNIIFKEEECFRQLFQNNQTCLVMESLNGTTRKQKKYNISNKEHLLATSKNICTRIRQILEYYDILGFLFPYIPHPSATPM